MIKTGHGNEIVNLKGAVFPPITLDTSNSSAVVMLFGHSIIITAVKNEVIKADIQCLSILITAVRSLVRCS